MAMRAVLFGGLLMASLAGSAPSFGHSNADRRPQGVGVELKRVDVRNVDAGNTAWVSADAKTIQDASSPRLHRRAAPQDRATTVRVVHSPMTVAVAHRTIAIAPRPEALVVAPQSTKSENFTMLLAGIGLIGFLARRRHVGGRMY
jgi:hypothetical protein